MAGRRDAIVFESSERYKLGERVLPNRFIFYYDTKRWSFRDMVMDYFGVQDLERLHLVAKFNPISASNQSPNYEATRNSWAISKVLRAAVAPASQELLRSLLQEYVAEFLYPIFGIQPLASMRVNFHGSKSILHFHTDAEYGQTSEAINLWLPVTKAWGTNSMYLESEVGCGDFTPLELDFGQACIFRGTELRHGAVDNDSESTRISYDIRFRVRQPGLPREHSTAAPIV
jgi:hypothetical protein